MPKARSIARDTRIAVLVPDGAADFPLEELGGRTPLEASNTPAMDSIASGGMTGLARTVPVGMTPGSDVANLSLLGYDPGQYHPGRGPLEAASMGLEIEEGWTVFRCNLVNVEDEVLSDYSAGHIGDSESGRIIGSLGEALGSDDVRFYPGKSYRHILMIRGDFLNVECTPPHDIMGDPFESRLPRGEGSEEILRLIEESRPVLADHEVNRERVERGKSPANMIWPWGQGTRPRLPTVEERFEITGGIISAVDLVKGIGRCAGLEVQSVPGATGYLDTDYEGKGRAALNVLSEHQLVFVHVEAPDEASHMAATEEKILAIERFDQHVVRPVLGFMSDMEKGRIMVVPDHHTLISTRTHDATPVPFAMSGSEVERDGSQYYSESEAQAHGKYFEKGWRLFYYLMGESE